MKPATSNMASRWDLPRSIIKSYAVEKGAWPWARKAPQIIGFPFNISATTKDSDFRIGSQVGFAKTHHKIPPRRNVGVVMG